MSVATRAGTGFTIASQLWPAHALGILVGCGLGLAAVATAADSESPGGLAAAARARLIADAEHVVAAQTDRLAQDPANVDALSMRGDAQFILARFPEAVADYNAMVAIDPSLDAAHWRRGIAWFYTGDYELAASQFERYHTVDQIDRENGIWRYLSQARLSGVAAARQGLLKYEKDDREPFPDVFRLFSGTITPESIIERIDAAQISDDERDKRQFYANLYIGLNDVIARRNQQAQIALRKAVTNSWAPQAGYGARWMWHVARVQLELLDKAATDAEPAK